MMLLIDAGNSAVKTRLLGDDRLDDKVFPILSGLDQSGIVQYLQQVAPVTIVLASVMRGDNHLQLVDLLQRLQPGAALVELHTPTRLGDLVNAYRDHRELGVDRWLSVVGAASIAPGDAMVVDAGTAIKIELLSRRRGYLGGAILPGFNTSLERFRALFPALDFDSASVRDQHLPGVSTAECVRVPDEAVTPDYIGRLIEQGLDELEADASILLAGQDAPRIAATVHRDHQVVTDLVFTGMLKQMQALG